VSHQQIQDRFTSLLVACTFLQTFEKCLIIRHLSAAYYARALLS
jgi:hypothetical protein